MHVPIIVDDPALREVLVRTLESNGYRVLTAGSEQDARSLPESTARTIILFEAGGGASQTVAQMIEALRQDVADRDTPILVVSQETGLPRNVIALVTPLRTDHLLTLIDWFRCDGTDRFTSSRESDVVSLAAR